MKDSEEMMINGIQEFKKCTEEYTMEKLMGSNITSTDSDLCAEFLANGIVKIPVEDMKALENIGNMIWGFSSANYGALRGLKYDSMHEIITNDHLNKFRLYVIDYLNSIQCIKASYFSLAKHALEILVGNELSMQRNINLSIQLPKDDSSLLSRHQDVLQGDSLYEVVLWVPLVDCSGTKSMFFQKRGSNKEEFIDCKYGECLIFSQNYWHGNVVNETNETRWSMNCRFKSLLSPYGDKKLGEFFEPISIKPATRLGAEYVASAI